MASRGDVYPGAKGFNFVDWINIYAECLAIIGLVIRGGTMKIDGSVSVGPGFLGILTLIFITMKLTGHIAWSWWWVLAPTWIPIVILLCVLGVILGLAIIAEFID